MYVLYTALTTPKQLVGGGGVWLPTFLVKRKSSFISTAHPSNLQTPNQFWSDFRSNISVLNYPLSEALRQAGYVYDAVWAAAFALDEVDRQLKAGVLQGRTSLQNFSYTDTGINQLIFNSAKKRMFRGVTVSLTFF